MKYRLPNGSQVQRRLGRAWTGRGRPPAGYFTRRTAEDELRTILVDADRGTLAGTEKSGATFADAAAEFVRYVGDVRGREPSTVGDYGGVIDGYLLETFGERAIEAISADDVERYRDRLLAEGRLSNRTIVRHLTVLHGIFKRAARVWSLERNPASADLVDRPPVRYSGEFEALDADELAAVARAGDDGQDAALFLSAAWTGLRLGELLALRWRDVDFAGGRVHVRLSYTNRREKAPKSGKIRSVPMMPELIPLFDGLSRRQHFTGADDLVFCDVVGRHLDAWALRRRFYAVLERAGVRRIRLHDLRHCFGSTAVRAFPLSDVQAMMGHANITTTMRYVHHRPGVYDGERLSAAFRGDNVSPLVSPTEQIEAN